MADANAIVKPPLPPFKSATLPAEEERDLNAKFKRLHDLIQLDVNFDQILESDDSTYGKVLKSELNDDGTINEGIINHALLLNRAWSVAAHTIDDTFEVLAGNFIRVNRNDDSATHFIKLQYENSPNKGAISVGAGPLETLAVTTNTVRSSTSEIILETAGSQDMRFRAGDLWSFEDVDDSNNPRVTIETATGNLVSTGTLKGTGLILEGGTYDTTLVPGTPTADVTYTFPADDGSGGDYLQTDGAGNMSWQTAPDEKVGVDSGATPDYIGAASNDGVLRTDAPLTYTDGGDFITLGIDQTAIDHDQLNNRAWSVAAHTMDTTLDMASNAIDNVASVTIDEDGWVGLGATSERLVFDGSAHTFNFKSDGSNQAFLLVNNPANTESIQIYKDNSYGYVYSTDELIMNAAGTTANLRAQSNATSISCGNDFVVRSKTTGGCYWNAGTGGFNWRDRSANLRVTMDETNGDFVPAADGVADLGSATYRWAEAHIDSLDIAGTTTVTSILDEDNMASDSDTALATQQSIKAYADGLTRMYVLSYVDGGRLSVATSADVARPAIAGTIKRVSFFRGAAGVAGSTIVDVNINGTTIFTTQANRPEIASTDGNDFVVSVTNMDVTAVSLDDYITMDYDSVETGNPTNGCVIVYIEPN